MVLKVPRVSLVQKAFPAIAKQITLSIAKNDFSSANIRTESGFNHGC